MAPERLGRWLDGFQSQHGALVWTQSPAGGPARAADDTTLVVQVPFPPRRPASMSPRAALLAHGLVPRTVGVLLVRRGGFAVGIAQAGRLVSSTVGSRSVHGRSAAGRWSQQRFARRREAQTRQAYTAAAEAAAAILVSAAPRLAALATGGDRRGVAVVLTDPRLAARRPLLVPRLLDVADPRLRVLQAVVPRVRALRVRSSVPS